MVNTVKDIESQGENLITQKGAATESQTVSHVKGKKNVITQDTTTSSDTSVWSKWGCIGTWIAIAVAVIIAIIGWIFFKDNG